NTIGFPEINVTVRTSAQAVIGDTIKITGNFSSGNIYGDDTLQTYVVGSFDPNDKQCLPAVLTPHEGNSGTFLDYTIRFQNTGNAPANKVRILDTLTQKIDLSSMQFVASSHPSTIQVQGERTLEFLFQDIMLPDSTSNEVASHGFVRFKVRSMPGLQIGDSITNRAAIYFDFNPPVITANCVTSIENISKIKDLETKTNLLITPNPSSGAVVRLSVPGQTLQGAIVSVADVSGRKVKVWQCLNSDFFEIPSGALQAGTWSITLFGNGWTAHETLLLIP
ncbi:MAG: DUF11 domain-containing protein, partial [Saprospiraceae bacterium]|nr:DUF11 domain-containing protein [Saprospiraceae bacterium]